METVCLWLLFFDDNGQKTSAITREKETVIRYSDWFFVWISGSQLKSRSFQKLYERISRVGHVKVSDSNGSQRPVWVTYRREYPVENNDWGDFQTHRRVLGIITIGAYKLKVLQGIYVYRYIFLCSLNLIFLEVFFWLDLPFATPVYAL